MENWIDVHIGDQNEVKKIKITRKTFGSYFYDENEVYEVKQSATIHWEVINGEHVGRYIAKGHCEVIE